jgi:hypothetical protein
MALDLDGGVASAGKGSTPMSGSVRLSAWNRAGVLTARPAGSATPVLRVRGSGHVDQVAVVTSVGGGAASLSKVFTSVPGRARHVCHELLTCTRRAD